MVADESTQQAIVIDPGGDFEQIAQKLRENQLTITAIVHTHTHIDHVGATAPLQRYCGAEAHIHEEDRFLYNMLPVQAALLGLQRPEKCDVLGTLVDDFTLHAGQLELGVLHTPGHTPGSVSFYIEHEGQRVLFSGDTLFQRGIGRTDLWGGDADQLLRSIHGKLLSLDDDTLVVPGHGPRTTIAEEREFNPYVRRR